MRRSAGLTRRHAERAARCGRTYTVRVLAQFTFPCSFCGSTAGTFEAAEAGVVVIDGFLGRVTQYVVRVPAPEWNALADLDTMDACRFIHAIDPEWAPWYCPNCDAIYCRDHWLMQIEFEDDGGLPGWYDLTRGTCPRGHERVLDD